MAKYFKNLIIIATLTALAHPPAFAAYQFLSFPSPEEIEENTPEPTATILLKVQINFVRLSNNQSIKLFEDSESWALQDLNDGWKVIKEHYNKAKTGSEKDYWDGLNLYVKYVANDGALSALAEDKLKEAYHHLLSYLKTQPEAEKRAKTLLVLGDIATRLWHYQWGDAGCVYLIEVIRSNPGQEIARTAFKALNTHVHFGYTGSSGDNTPEDWAFILKELSQFSFEEPVFI